MHLKLPEEPEGTILMSVYVYNTSSLYPTLTYSWTGSWTPSSGTSSPSTLAADSLSPLPAEQRWSVQRNETQDNKHLFLLLGGHNGNKGLETTL